MSKKCSLQVALLALIVLLLSPGSTPASASQSLGSIGALQHMAICSSHTLAAAVYQFPTPTPVSDKNKNKKTVAPEPSPWLYAAGAVLLILILERKALKSLLTS